MNWGWGVLRTAGAAIPAAGGGCDFGVNHLRSGGPITAMIGGRMASRISSVRRRYCMASIIASLLAPPSRKRNGERHQENGHERDQNHDGYDAQRRCGPNLSKKFQGEVEHAPIIPNKSRGYCCQVSKRCQRTHGRERNSYPESRIKPVGNGPSVSATVQKRAQRPRIAHRLNGCPSN